MYGVQPYEGSFITLGILMMIIGLLLIGYANASGAAVNKTKQTFYLHITLVTFLLITDLTFWIYKLIERLHQKFWLLGCITIWRLYFYANKYTPNPAYLKLIVV